jgi:type I restriction enzyme S subunit
MALAGQGKTKGTVAILEIDATCNQSMAAIVPNSIVNNEYLFYWLHVNYERIRGLAGSEQRDGLNLQIIGDIFCPLPKIEEQIEIAQYLNRVDFKIDSLIHDITNQIEKLNEYRQSMISEAVTGKIDVRDWKAPQN